MQRSTEAETLLQSIQSKFQADSEDGDLSKPYGVFSERYNDAFASESVGYEELEAEGILKFKGRGFYLLTDYGKGLVLT